MSLRTRARSPEYVTGIINGQGCTSSQPYVGNASGCQSGEDPTGVYDGEQAINTISHELNESLTDPAGGSWYDANGYENGDKCSWDFGTLWGGAQGRSTTRSSTAPATSCSGSGATPVPPVC